MSMIFREMIEERMARTGKTFRQCCQDIGAAGGRKAAANKRRRAEEQKKFHAEQQRQVAMKLRDPDEVFTEQDRASIAQQSRRLA